MGRSAITQTLHAVPLVSHNIKLEPYSDGLTPQQTTTLRRLPLKTLETVRDITRTKVAQFTPTFCAAWSWPLWFGPPVWEVNLTVGEILEPSLILTLATTNPD